KALIAAAVEEIDSVREYCCIRRIDVSVGKELRFYVGASRIGDDVAELERLIFDNGARADHFRPANHQVGRRDRRSGRHAWCWRDIGAGDGELDAPHCIPGTCLYTMVPLCCAVDGPGLLEDRSVCRALISRWLALCYPEEVDGVVGGPVNAAYYQLGGWRKATLRVEYDVG